MLDLRTLKPLDTEAILATARKTGKVLVVHSANQLAGIGAEIAALIAEQAFEWLDAPVRRLGGLDTPVPFSPPLEDAYRPDAEQDLCGVEGTCRLLMWGVVGQWGVGRWRTCDSIRIPQSLLPHCHSPPPKPNHQSQITNHLP